LTTPSPPAPGRAGVVNSSIQVRNPHNGTSLRFAPFQINYYFGNKKDKYDEYQVSNFK
jgi:hypothetical protein